MGHSLSVFVFKYTFYIPDLNSDKPVFSNIVEEFIPTATSFKILYYLLSKLPNNYLSELMLTKSVSLNPALLSCWMS